MPSENLLTQEQQRLVNEFYATPANEVLLDKHARKMLWNKFMDTRDIDIFGDFRLTCPALFAEAEKALENEKNIQSAVFSECIYAQALSNKYGLTEFAPGLVSTEWLPREMLESLAAIGMHPRYIYRNPARDRFLVQAGGHAGVDSALISLINDELVAIEFKEPASKSSEPDLPPYGEDGMLAITEDFLMENPQFVDMVREQISAGLNFFDHIGNNINSFSPKSIEKAITENYAGKKVAVAICTEDTSGLLTLIPVGQVHRWARLEGEIRPAGRNDYFVYTPQRLIETIKKIGGDVRGEIVEIPMEALAESKQRGGSVISRLKIDSIFFVRTKDAIVESGIAKFTLKNVRQLRPTIAAKMFFEGLQYESVRKEYFDGA